MAISASVMATAMEAAIDAIDFTSGSIDNTAVILAICTAIVDEIQTNFIDSAFNAHTHLGTGGSVVPPQTAGVLLDGTSAPVTGVTATPLPQG